MLSYFGRKTWVVLSAILALIALTGLAIGLRSISFREAQAFGRKEAELTAGDPAVAIQGILDLPWQTQLAAVIFLFIFLVLIILLLSPEARKRLIRFVIRFALICAALYFLLSRYPEVLEQFSLGQPPLGDFAQPASNDAPVPVFTPPQANPWMAYLISFIIAALMVLFLWRIYSAWKELSASSSESPMDKIAIIARKSLNELSSGRESTDVIMNCYYRMSDVVSNTRNINRGDSMTPTEFASRLEMAGFPPDSVRTLTRLFETVRYGGYKSDTKMVNEAVACLTSILHYCGEAA